MSDEKEYTEAIAPWANLASAVVAQAIMDYGNYKALVRLIKKHPEFKILTKFADGTAIREAKKEIASIKNFVGSKQYTMYTNLTPEEFYRAARKYWGQRFVKMESDYSKSYKKFMSRLHRMTHT
jgi:hypothetical protein